uniref:Si:ch211-160o17.2 n=1 Tax=Oncorhynchus kisutch TaxID=8019 RepID=A0A8C7JBQ7_ONCKI
MSTYFCIYSVCCFYVFGFRSDATSQYIEGREEVVEELRNSCLCPSGLQCALVLIGVYLRATGEPVIGVINQPFNHKDPTGWKGKHFWGVSCGSVKASSVLRPKERPAQCPGLSVVLSSSEKQVVKEVLAPLCRPDKLMYASGPGYKILCVILGLADIYVLSEGSTFKWDSCGPMPCSLHWGGHHDQGELTYHQSHSESPGADRWANQGGLSRLSTHCVAETCFLSQSYQNVAHGYNPAFDWLRISVGLT